MRRSSSTQGLLKMSTSNRSRSLTASRMAARTASMSFGSMVRTHLTPMEATTRSRSSSCASRPWICTPLKGLPWRPVIAVVLLSRMQMVPAPALYTVLISELKPEWANVESPMMPTTGRVLSRPSASSNPCAMETDAPMSTHVSMAESGGSAPSV